VRPEPGQHNLFEVAACHLRDVEEWTERPRREKWVARPEQGARREALVVCKTTHERGLANPGLASEQHHAAARGRHNGFQLFGQQGQVL
jgi:hypothetical protein